MDFMPIATDPNGTKWDWLIEPDDEFPNFAENHVAIREDGLRVELPWSRFKHFELKHFKVFVAAGLIGTGGNWWPEEIVAINVRKEAA